MRFTAGVVITSGRCDRNGGKAIVEKVDYVRRSRFFLSAGRFPFRISGLAKPPSRGNRSDRMVMGLDAPPGKGDDRNRERITIVADEDGGLPHEPRPPFDQTACGYARRQPAARPLRRRPA